MNSCVLIYYRISGKYQVDNAFIISERYKSKSDSIITIILYDNDYIYKYIKDKYEESDSIILMKSKYPPNGKLRQLTNKIIPYTINKQIIIYYDRIDGKSILYPILLASKLKGSLACYQHGENEGYNYDFTYANGWKITARKKGRVNRILRSFKIIRNIILTCIEEKIIISNKYYKIIIRYICQLEYRYLIDYVFLLNDYNRYKVSGLKINEHIVGSLIKERIKNRHEVFHKSMLSYRQRSIYKILIYSSGIYRASLIERRNTLDERFNGHTFLNLLGQLQKYHNLDVFIKLKNNDEKAGFDYICNKYGLELNNSVEPKSNIHQYDVLILPTDSVSCIEASLLNISYLTYNIWNTIGIIGNANQQSLVPSIYEYNINDEIEVSNTYQLLISLIKQTQLNKIPGGIIKPNHLTKIVGELDQFASEGMARIAS